MTKKTMVRLALVGYSASAGIGVASYLIYGSAWRLIIPALCAVGVGLCIWKLVKS